MGRRGPSPGTQPLRGRRRVGCRLGESRSAPGGRCLAAGRPSISVPWLPRPRSDRSPFLTPRSSWTFETRPRAMSLAIRVGIATALMSCLPLRVAAAAPRSSAQVPGPTASLAHARCGPLSAAELAVVRSAPRRELAWCGPDANPDNPANDPTHGKDWGPERSVRAELVRWLHTDPEVSRQIDPSGLGIAGARITGTLDLSYVKADTPITLVRCYIPDGIDLTSSQLQGFEVRASVTGPISADMSELARDLSVRFGTYGPLSLFRSRIGGNLDC